jgi:hypothetical protein
VQVADAGSKKRSRKRPPYTVTGSDLSSICGKTEAWIRPQVRRDLLRLGLCNIQPAGEKGGIVLFKALAHLLPGEELLRGGFETAANREQQCAACPKLVSHRALRISARTEWYQQGQLLQSVSPQRRCFRRQVKLRRRRQR